MITVEEKKKQLDDILGQVAKTQNIDNFETDLNIEADYGDGFVAELYTGNIQNKDTGETTAVAIKKAPHLEFNYGPKFKNEDLFYSVIFPAFNNLQNKNNVLKYFDNVPKFFCGSIDARNEYIAMENLKSLGYVMFDKKEYLDNNHLSKIFKIYGKFHALSYVLRKKDAEKYHDISKDLRDLTKLETQFMKEAIIVAVDALDPENDKTLLEELLDFKENVMETIMNSCTYNGDHRCIIHGDCWSNNMLFKYSETGQLLDVKFIDFQLCQDNSPIHDLSHFFYSGASKKDFDDLDNYLQIYHTAFSGFARELGENLDELFSFKTLRHEWKENALFGVFFGIYSWRVKLIPKENFDDLLNPNKEETQSKEERYKLWDVLLNRVHNTDSFKERTTAILRHAFEYDVLTRNKIIKINNRFEKL